MFALLLHLLQPLLAHAGVRCAPWLRDKVLLHVLLAEEGGGHRRAPAARRVDKRQPMVIYREACAFAARSAPSS